ncbi:hypothetical protein BU24DRAFT_164640 [Aaosphaeria arxii CBS 175.79]|uniref:non-specific serine/threonine protein kinase n=1 Tax=Aaosphaeria arxii CBS 175.79 TaxID=1450172 RepID=A0A6A5XYM9_9PLEO|nr:uncharacterized protein BU24DRAFT_164640 [Aaosphaeria arxii CBS 175.79]KAF2018076.1 hypothetical protein BU24DRAFT_164640 [Aaosphaeria arxii CBS 175.79]
MVSYPPKASHSHSRSQPTPSGSASNTPGHVKRGSASSNHRTSSREDRPPSRKGSAQRAAQDVPGLSDYQLGDCLGKGAFGSVYRALNWNTGETVAVKQVRLENLGGAELKTIMLEIDLLKNLNHANIVKYQGFVKTPDSLYIVLEYCENGSLHSICKNFGKFPENLVALYMSQVLHGLLYLHEQGVIHRDIKGANILTTKEGLVKLADFGVATKASGLDQASVVGTPYWMAPEVIELSGAATSSDIWSLGCTVIELIEGKPPYHKLQPMQALFRIVNDEHPPIPGSASSLLRDFLMECFQKNPTLRISAKRLLKHPWIRSAKRTVPAIPTKPTEYTEAVKSVQEWNEALKSPGSLRRSARSTPAAKKSPPSSKSNGSTRKPSLNMNVHIPKPRPTAESFRSPEMDVSDNWDDDFAESISPTALHLPHLRPQDNFAGLFSSDKLKAFASFEAVTEESSTLDGEATVKSPLDWRHYLQRRNSSTFEEPETVKYSSTRVKPSTSRSASGVMQPEERHDGPKTAFLRGVPKATQLPKTKVAALARPSTLFREDSVEDYSDLMPTDDGAFEKRVRAMQGHQPQSVIPQMAKANNSSPAESFSPRLFHPSDLKSAPKSTRDTKSNGNVRQRSVSSTSTRKMQRSQSEIEIQKYAEGDEQDDFSDVQGDIRRPARAESDSGSDYSSMALVPSKMSSSFILPDEDEIDPFANLEEGIENINLENNVARDRDDRLAKQTESLVGCLKTSQPDDVLLDITDQLIQVLYESPDKKSIVLRSHGLLPILEILQTMPPNEVVLRLLKIINMIILEDAESQESLSFLGGIPIISTYAYKKYPSEIRKEAAAFVRQMYQTSTLTLQMFIGCGGINVLVEFLEEDIDTERDLVLIGVNGVWSVFELQGPTPKNDFCRIFSRSSVLYPLSLVLNRVVDEEGELADLIEGRIVNIFLIFSQAESHVKDLVADRMILKRVLKDLRKMAPAHMVTMLKFIKNLSMLSSTHEALQNSNAIDLLVELLKSSKDQPLYREISNQILNTMYNLCRHNKSRQEEAALSDIIPILKDIVAKGGPLKEFALPILCELAHSGKVARKMLWDGKGLLFYISMLADRNWQVPALDAIFVWLQEETARVEQYLLSSNFSTSIIASYTSPELSQSTFENMLEPLQKLVRLSPPIAESLACREIFTRTAQKLGHKDAVTRLNLLRILRTICDATEEGCTLIKAYGVYEPIFHLSNHDPAILVRQMAEELVRACDEVGKRSTSRASGFRRPTSSAGVRAGSGSSNGSTIVSGMTPPTPTSLKSTFAMPLMPSSTPSSLSLRERERLSRSQSTAGIWDLQEEPAKPAPLIRSSTAFGALGTPTGSPSVMSGVSRLGSSRPPSRDASSLSRMESSRPSSSSSELNAPGKSRLPKARQGRLSEVASRRRDRESGVGLSLGQADENQTPGLGSGRSEASSSTPLPRLQIARRRRETSGGEMGMPRRRGSRVNEE